MWALSYHGHTNIICAGDQQLSWPEFEKHPKEGSVVHVLGESLSYAQITFCLGSWLPECPLPLL